MIISKYLSENIMVEKYANYDYGGEEGCLSILIETQKEYLGLVEQMQYINILETEYLIEGILRDDITRKFKELLNSFKDFLENLFSKMNNHISDAMTKLSMMFDRNKKFLDKYGDLIDKDMDLKGLVIKDVYPISYEFSKLLSLIMDGSMNVEKSLTQIDKTVDNIMKSLKTGAWEYPNQLKFMINDAENLEQQYYDRVIEFVGQFSDMQRYKELFYKSRGAHINERQDLLGKQIRIVKYVEFLETGSGHIKNLKELKRATKSKYKRILSTLKSVMYLIDYFPEKIQGKRTKEQEEQYKVLNVLLNEVLMPTLNYTKQSKLLDTKTIQYAMDIERMKSKQSRRILMECLKYTGRVD